MEGPSQAEQKKKSEVLKELKQLRLKIQNLEREKSSHIYNRHSDHHHEFSQLQEMEKRMDAERKAEKTRLQQQLTKMSMMVKKFQRELKDVRPTPEFVEKLKVIMEEIESHISDYKTHQREQYEEMMRDERITSQEVAALDKRFDSWSQQGSEATVAMSSRQAASGALSQRDTPRDLPPEVKTFERFVASSGGPRGGWDDYDHGTFLKFRNRHKGKLSFLRELVASLPTRTDVEIRQHEEWYQQYLALNDKKKDAIQRWKERKEVEKDEMLSHAGKDEQLKEQSQKQQEEARQRLAQEERDTQRAQLNRWKVEKELERAQEEERKLREELRKAEETEAWRRKQIERRVQVEEYKKVKKEAEEAELRQQRWERQIEEEEKRRQATEQISKYRQRDLSNVKQKRAVTEAQKKAESERRQRIEQSLRDNATSHVRRDPSRLLQPTAGWKERQKDPSPQGSGPVIHMPHRAVPTWRQGLH